LASTSTVGIETRNIDAIEVVGGEGEVEEEQDGEKSSIHAVLVWHLKFKTTGSLRPGLYLRALRYRKNGSSMT
jgi:hypothetical protein